MSILSLNKAWKSPKYWYLIVFILNLSLFVYVWSVIYSAKPRVKICVSRLHSQHRPITRDLPEVCVRVCVHIYRLTFTQISLSLGEPVLHCIHLCVQKFWCLCSCMHTHLLCVYLCVVMSKEACEPGQPPEATSNSEMKKQRINEGRSDEKRKKKEVKKCWCREISDNGSLS